MQEAEILHRVQALLPGRARVVRDPQDGSVRVPGAYALLLHLPAPVCFSRARIGSGSLVGWHVYAGSARGGGGIGGRLARHFVRDKPIRWHVDELTNAAGQIVALAVPDGSECDIGESLLRSGQFAIALPGFGSSDCRSCAGHLFRPA